MAETKGKFITTYRKPIPSIYSNVIQELLVQQHLMRYNTTYKYDPVFALGFVTVYDQLMDGYPNEADRDAIFKAYIAALNEDPELYRFHSSTRHEILHEQFDIQFFIHVPRAISESNGEICRSDAKKLEEWAAAQSGSGIADFTSKDGEVEAALKDIAERAAGKEAFHYSRFFAIGLFRLLECANASDPAVLETVNVNNSFLVSILDSPWYGLIIHKSNADYLFTTRLIKNPHAISISEGCLFLLQ